jgi:hypothetical protein
VLSANRFLCELAACIEVLRQRFHFSHYTADAPKGALHPDPPGESSRQEPPTGPSHGGDLDGESQATGASSSILRRWPRPQYGHKVGSVPVRRANRACQPSRTDASDSAGVAAASSSRHTGRQIATATLQPGSLQRLVRRRSLCCVHGV